jgi:predicted nucleic acid-binding protein
MYLFDTDILANLLKKQPSLSLLAHLKELRRNDQYTASLNIAELIYIVQKSPDPAHYQQILDHTLLPYLHILPFDLEASKKYGHLNADLDAQGIHLPERSLQIASICLTNDLTLITARTQDLDGIQGLRFMNWLD